jgi:acyl-CoA thioesterase FadM
MTPQSPTVRATDQSVTVPIRPSDLGPTGHVHQSRYHEYLGEARAAVLAHHGCDNRDYVVARVELDHRDGIPNEERAVVVGGRVVTVGRTSVRVEHWICLADGALVAEGSSILVAWDPAASTKRAIGAEERTRLSR